MLNYEKIISQHISKTATVFDEIEKRDLLKDIGIDSLRLVELVISLEEDLNLRFTNSDLEPTKIITVQDIYDLVTRYLK
jgi:acyl carrier protein